MEWVLVIIYAFTAPEGDYMKTQSIPGIPTHAECEQLSEHIHRSASRIPGPGETVTATTHCVTASQLANLWLDI